MQKGQSINYEQFLTKLPDKYRTSANSLFKTRLTSSKPKKWSVECDPATFSKLWALSEKPQSRTHASQLGNSHNYRVSANLIMVYHQGITDLRPDVVYVSKHKIIQSFKAKSKLLLIENEENFIQFNCFCKSLSKLTGERISIDSFDIALGSGNRATSNLLIGWYNQYDEVLCAFDYDLGGLQMFATLKKSLEDKLSFFQPQTYTSILSFFVNTPNTSTKLKNAIKLADKLNFNELSNVFFETRCFMEQEQLLREINV